MTSPLEAATSQGYIGTAVDQSDPDTYEAPHSSGGQAADHLSVQATAETATTDLLTLSNAAGTALVHYSADSTGTAFDGGDLYLRCPDGNGYVDVWAYDGGSAGLGANDGAGHFAGLSLADPAGAQLQLWGPAGQTNDPIQILINSAPMFTVHVGGDIELHTHGGGIVLASPNGTRYRITVADDGTVSAAAA